MARRTKLIIWDLSAFEAVRRSPEVEAALQSVVDGVLEEVSDPLDGGYDGGVEPGRGRSRGYVVTTTLRAMRSEARDHTLLRALGNQAGRSE